MVFDPDQYGPEVARVLALGGNGARPMPLAVEGCTSEDAKRVLAACRADDLFEGSFAPGAALSGLWLYFGCFEESHRLSQDIQSSEGSYWHGIAHRQEPDASNAAYWFRQTGRHPVFTALCPAADEIIGRGASEVRFSVQRDWDPFAFIDFCEYARRRPGSRDELVACEIQLAEWQLLFDYCARPRR